MPKKTDQTTNTVKEQPLFISSLNRSLVSITDRVLCYKIVPIAPVMMDYEMWNFYHKEDDIKLKWLDDLLLLCGFFLERKCGGVQDWVFFFSYDDIGNPQFIHCTHEIDTHGHCYFLLTTREREEYKALH